jgi:hypothetical protein
MAIVIKDKAITAAPRHRQTIGRACRALRWLVGVAGFLVFLAALPVYFVGASPRLDWNRQSHSATR